MTLAIEIKKMHKIKEFATYFSRLGRCLGDFHEEGVWVWFEESESKNLYIQDKLRWYMFESLIFKGVW